MSEEWFFDGPPDNHIVWRDSENRVCFMAHSNGVDPESDTKRAALVAAAPNLLEVAQLANAAINAAFAQADAEMRDHDRAAAKHDAIVRDFRQKVRAAILKATQS